MYYGILRHIFALSLFIKPVFKLRHVLKFVLKLGRQKKNLKGVDLGYPKIFPSFNFF
jgi:hypothetical protein